jgi:uncharacterized NAD-dependent epimerase/dehydratase family protein
MQLPYPYLLFLGDATEEAYAKTAFGLRDWAPERCLGEWSCDSATVTTGLPRMTPKEARVRGARGLVIGIANTGGVIGESWIPLLVEAVESGLDIVSGLHVKLTSVPQLKAAAVRCGRQLIDIRTPPPNIPCGSGSKRPGKRLLTVGTDCALGKKYTALAIARAFKARGQAVDFRATGQTGILISGGGMPMDAVVADFEAGAAELLSPAPPPPPFAGTRYTSTSAVASASFIIIIVRARWDCRYSTAGINRALLNPVARPGLLRCLSFPDRIISSKNTADSTP